MATRKNVNSLTPVEKSDFVQAVKALKANGTYDQYVLWHVQAMAQGTPPGTPPSTRNAAHRGPAFLPWHREFLRRFEVDLQLVSGNPDLGLPYWDWATDSALANPASAPVWANDLMGGQGDPVTAGPFAFSAADPNTWTIINDNGNPAGGLVRRFGVSVATLPTQADVNNALVVVPYDNAPWDRSSNPSFRNQLEGWLNGPALHNRVHVWVGGSMLPATSPNDPVFFLHHCFVDKLWADWQAANPSQGYLPLSGGPAGHNLNDALAPWPQTPNDVVDHQTLGYVYDTELGGAIAFREGWISFPRRTGRKQRVSQTVQFDRPIDTYQVFLKGFNIRYDNGDHHILENEIDLDSSRSGSTVTVNADFLLRDSSGNIDDPYQGWVNFVVMAQVN